ncbi:MAG TPA: gliding motility-associated C-terminal domain-containing protein [Saprospiraceae bacterium]|nr:gliding motility-associated C-terminal domain-containing protein [Saprospiraceae bacterium]HMQ82998.1 gliding motility-associated C-terminal domain-containing protein [Saprospiraceae bacterium]
MRQIFWILVFANTFGTLSAQVFPPNLICVQNDTLVWELPANGCGAFNAYLIYASQNQDGPYTLLSSVANPGQTTFFHLNAGNGVWYYYMESDYNCPGEPVLQSDTLDNLIPILSPIDVVSVNGAEVSVSWSPSPSPEVIGYIVLRNVPGQGTVALDTVYAGTSYIDMTADPDSGSESYLLEALDACGNKSLISDPHQTIFLEAEGNSACERSISLSWNLYQNWPQGIDKQEVWVSAGGDLPQLIAVLTGTTNTYKFENADDAVEYCFFIRAISRGDEFVSMSNELCLSVDVVQAVRQLAIINASVLPDNTVEVSWVWNDNAAIETYDLSSSSNNVNFGSIINGMPTTPLQENNMLIDITGSPESNRIYYQIEVVDACDVATLSNKAASIHLSAASLSGLNKLTWTPYFNTIGSSLSYDIYRKDVGGDTFLASVSGSPLEYEDEIDVNNPNQLIACYYIVAKAEVALDGEVIEVSSTSNVDCAVQEPKVYIPTAFSPNEDGNNDEFRPFLQFGNPANYLLQVFDRWGGMVFESTDINQSWNGKKGDRIMPVGLYGYYLRFEQLDGKLFETSGEISLIR